MRPALPPQQSGQHDLPCPQEPPAPVPPETSTPPDVATFDADAPSTLRSRVSTIRLAEVK